MTSLTKCPGAIFSRCDSCRSTGHSKSKDPLGSDWPAMTSFDIFALLYLLLLFLAVLLSNSVFANFIAAKPEGRKTVLGKILLRNPFKTLIISAKVSVLISQISTVAYAITILPVFAGVLFRPFQTKYIIFIYYLYRCCFTFFFSLLTFKSILKTSFLLDFDKMSGKGRIKKF